MKKAYALIGILLTCISTTLLLAEEEREGDHKHNREDGNREKGKHVDGELREWLDKQHRQIESLKKRGRSKEAEHLIRETRKVMAEKMGHSERGKRDEHRNHHHSERGDREHDGDPLEHWVHQREREIRELAEAGKHEEAKKLQEETRRIVEEKLRHRRNEERERHHNEHADRDNKGNELQRWAHAQERRIHELHESNRHEEAERLERQLVEKMEHFHREREHEHHERERDRGERHHGEKDERFERWVVEQKRHIHELRENNRHEEAQRHENELAEKIDHFHHQREQRQHDGERHEGHRRMEERVNHLKVAIEHLHAAGMHDVAEEVKRELHVEVRRELHVVSCSHRPTIGIVGNVGLLTTLKTSYEIPASRSPFLSKATRPVAPENVVLSSWPIKVVPSIGS